MVTLTVENDTYLDAPKGIDCHYVCMGRTGLKVYVNEEKRDLSHGNQVWLHSRGLAPRALFKCRVKIEGCTYYAFETDAVEVKDRYKYECGGRMA